MILEIGHMLIQPTKLHTALDPSTPDGRVLQEAYTQIVGAEGGPRRVFWGAESRDESRVWAVFEWEGGLLEHAEFAKGPGASLTARLPTVFLPGYTRHAALSPTPLAYPITQFVLVFFPASLDTAAQKSVAGAFEGVRGSLMEGEGEDEGEGVQDVSCGWGVEQDFPVPERAVGVRVDAKRADARLEREGTVFFFLVGWLTTSEKGLRRVRDRVERLALREGAFAVDTFEVQCVGLERGVGGSGVGRGGGGDGRGGE